MIVIVVVVAVVVDVAYEVARSISILNPKRQVLNFLRPYLVESEY